MARLVNDFLNNKWRQAHRFFYVNKDGILTPEDFTAIADNISKMSNATAEQAAKTRQQWLKWIPILQPNTSIVIDEDRFKAVFEEMYTTDVENLKNVLRGTVTDQFDRIDLDGDGSISLEEFEIFYKAVGIEDKQLTRRNFTNIDKNGDGVLQREEYIDEIVRHYTDPNPITGVTFLHKTADEK